MLLAAFLSLSTIQFCSVFDWLHYAYCKQSKTSVKCENKATILPHRHSQVVDAYSGGQCSFDNMH